METQELIRTKPQAKKSTAFFEELYETAFPSVARFVSKMNGSFEDAKDIFQDALVIFYEKTQRPDFRPAISSEAYLLGIAKHLWIRKFNRDHKNVPLDRFEAQISLDDEIRINEPKLVRLLESTGKKCLDLLRAFYYEKMPMRNIAHAFNFRSEHSATVQKYKCIEKIREEIKNKSVSYEDFTD
jgi:RNA polymerase sigma factor (sigma-70 family)